MRDGEPRHDVRDEVEPDEERGVGQRAPADHCLPRDVDAREPEAGQRADRDQIAELSVSRSAHLGRASSTSSDDRRGERDDHQARDHEAHCRGFLLRLCVRVALFAGLLRRGHRAERDCLGDRYGSCMWIGLGHRRERDCLRLRWLRIGRQGRATAPRCIVSGAAGAGGWLSSARASSSAETTIVTSAGCASRSGRRTLSSGWSVSSSSGYGPTCSTVRLVGRARHRRLRPRTGSR